MQSDIPKNLEPLKLGNRGKSAIIKSHFIFRFWNYMVFGIYALNCFLTNVAKQKSYVMPNLVRISCYRMLSDQSVHINETFKSYPCMTFHQKQEKVSENLIALCCNLMMGPNCSLKYRCTIFRFVRKIMVADIHDDVIKWKHFPRYWPFVRGIHRSPVNSSHKGQWCGALMFSLICV